jgi:hypothetical protein
MEISSPSPQTTLARLEVGNSAVKISPPSSAPNDQANNHSSTLASSQLSYLAQVVKLISNTNIASVKILSTLQTIQIESADKLKPGQLIRIIPEAGGLKLTANPQQTIDQILRLLLPRQGSIKDALSNLVKMIPDPQTVHPKGTVSDAKANEIMNIVAALVKQLPSRGEIVKPELLKQLIQNTGLFHSRESVAEKPVFAQNQTFKSTIPLVQSLLPILKALFQNSPENAKSEGSNRIADLIARIILNQIRPLNNVVGEEVETRRLELIARNDNQIDGFNIQFTSPKANQQKENWSKNPSNEEALSLTRKWTVRLSFNFPELGKITAIIHLSAEKQLEMNFWTERSTTFYLIEEHRQKFQKKVGLRMETEGISGLKIKVFEGEAPSFEEKISSSLINEIV